MDFKNEKKRKNKQMFCEDVINFGLKTGKITKRIDFFNVKKQEILL